VRDSDYNRREGYLKRQSEFQYSSKVIRNGEGVTVPFLNIHNKGYLAHMAAWLNDNQCMLQPVWAKNHVIFTHIKTIPLASEATDRGGGGERAVNIAKQSGYINQGFQSNMCPKRFNKAWITLSFKANFMFEQVL
jgi:hypothetical protein